MDWKTETRKLSDLKPWAKNPRQANQKQADDLDASLDRFGVADPLIINPDGLIIGGHFRYDRLLKKHGLDYTVDVRIPENSLTEKQIEELNIRLNANSGSWDWEIIANHFEVPEVEEWGLEVPDFEGAFGENFSLPENEKEPFQQMTFTLHDSQVTTVKAAIAKADITSEVNENSNGNALANICEVFCGS